MLQSDILNLKTNSDYAKSWQQLLIMYRSRYEKRLIWKEKSQDFKKIEQALAEQQKQLEEMEKNLSKPIKIKKKKKNENKFHMNNSKEAIVCMLDLENKIVEPFGNYKLENERENEEGEEEEEEEEKSVVELKKIEFDQKSTSPSSNDPFFLNSQHHITNQKRTNHDKNDDKTFIEHSYFVDALSSSSNRRDGGGSFARKKWAHLSLPNRSRCLSNKTFSSNGTVVL